MTTVTLHLGDCLEYMRTMQDKSVDAVITDPPYGLNDGGGKVSRRNGEMVKFTAGEWDDILPINWINLAVTALRDGCWITVFTDNLSVNTVWGVLQQNGANPKQTFYWIKNNPPPQPRRNFCSGVETAVVATKGAVKKWNGGGATVNYYREPLVHFQERFHPTQKPIDLMKFLIVTMTQPGDTVLDPFMGSGTTGVACVQLGRNFIGCEIDPTYYAIAERRIRDAQAQPNLFEAQP